MPDTRRHRGRHPDDDRLFAAAQIPILRTAVAELAWLLTRGYAPNAALKVVGDHHNLTVRQRTAVRRAACGDAALAAREAKRRPATSGAGQSLAIDGYNLLITVESALSGGLIVVGRDGCCRDLASVHGTYRKVEETRPAVMLIADHLHRLKVANVRFYLDQPVSNSGRLKGLMAEWLAPGGLAADGPAWHVALDPSPDRVLADSADLVVTSDSNVLDGCGAWVNLAADIITQHVPDAWVVDLREGQG